MTNELELQIATNIYTSKSKFHHHPKRFPPSSSFHNHPLSPTLLTKWPPKNSPPTTSPAPHPAKAGLSTHGKVPSPFHSHLYSPIQTRPSSYILTPYSPPNPQLQTHPLPYPLPRNTLHRPHHSSISIPPNDPGSSTLLATPYTVPLIKLPAHSDRQHLSSTSTIGTLAMGFFSAMTLCLNSSQYSEKP